MEKFKTNTSTEIIRMLKRNCARYGIPNVLISDNATTFTSAEFAYFTKAYEIEHRATSPKDRQCNRMAESVVKNTKWVLRKNRKVKQDKL